MASIGKKTPTSELLRKTHVFLVLPAPSSIVAASSILPTGFTVPPWPYLTVLGVGLAVVGIGLWRLRPQVTNWTAVGLAPWILFGGIAHGLYQLALYPPVIAPLFGTMAVYLTVSVVVGALWLGVLLVAQRRSATPTHHTALVLGGLGALAVVGSVSAGARAVGTVQLFWPIVIILLSVGISGVGWLLLRRGTPSTTELTGRTGQLVVLGHTVDGVSTAVGYDVFNATERTPLSAALLELGETLPTASLIGAGWLFVLVKLLLAGGLLVLFEEYLRDRPTEARILLVVLAAVGLGPGTQNLTLYVLG